MKKVFKASILEYRLNLQNNPSVIYEILKYVVI